MISWLQIENFKSIRTLNIPCGKVNVFIGEPNSGKSNIIEAMALQSEGIISDSLNKKMVRYQSIGDLFFDSNFSKAIKVKTSDHELKLEFATHENGNPKNEFNLYVDTQKDPATMEHSGKIMSSGRFNAKNVRLYNYERQEAFRPNYQQYLSVPKGDNLPGLLLSNPELKKWVSDLFRTYGYKLMLRPLENEISMSKEVNQELYDYRYANISETLQRLVFYSLAVKSNQNSVLMFDEPESNMFPYYIKEFAEQLTEDETNQFFIATHNPYLLGSILEKSNKQDLNVFIVRMEQFETKVHQCTQDQIQDLLSLGSGSFFSLENILAKNQIFITEKEENYLTC